MTKRVLSIAALALVMMTSGQAKEACDKSYYLPTWDHQAPTVDAYNFVRAETDMQMKGYSSKPFTFGQFTHGRKAYDVQHQVTPSANRDTIYSFGVSTFLSLT